MSKTKKMYEEMFLICKGIYIYSESELNTLYTEIKYKC